MNPIATETIETNEFTSALSTQLVNRTTGANILSQCPHEDISPEIAAIVVSGPNRTPVTYEDAADHQLTRGELMATAIQNQSNDAYQLEPMNNMLGISSEDSGPVQMLVLTNRDANLGSGEILNPVAMQEASDRLESEQLYVIPSSTHEVLLLPRNCGVTPDELDLIVHEVNEQVVLPKDRLADHSLVYDHRTRSLSEAHAEQSRSEQQDRQLSTHSDDELIVNVANTIPSAQSEPSHERRHHA